MSRPALIFIAITCALAACGAVPAESLDDAAAAAIDAAPPPVDAASCPRDRFDGTALGEHWIQGRIGTAPEYAVEDGWLRLHNAAPAVPPRTWLDNLNFDRGNQMAWALPIGEGDFRLTARASWRSETAAAWLAGIGLTGPDDLLEVWVGFEDGSTGNAGRRVARIRNRGGADHSWVGESATTATTAGSTDLVVRRAGGTLVIELDGEQVLTREVRSALSRIVIVNLRLRNGEVVYPFGQFGLDELAVTLPSCTP